MSNKEKIAVNCMLCTTSMLSGSSYAYRKMALLFVGPFFFNAWRYLLAFFVLFISYLISERIRKGRGKPSGDLKPAIWQAQRGVILGLFFSVGVTFQQIGLITSNAGKCGFITSLYIFFTPIISRLILGKHISVKIWVGVIIAAAGLFFISAGNSFSIVTGDVLYLLSAVLFAIHIILIGNFVGYSNPILLVSVQMLTCSVLNAFLFLFVGDESTFAGLLAAIWPVIYTGVFTISLGNLLQFIAQKKASPSITAIIMSLESVFAAVFAALIISERMNALQLTGCGLIFLAILISQIEKTQRTKE